MTESAENLRLTFDEFLARVFDETGLQFEIAFEDRVASLTPTDRGYERVFETVWKLGERDAAGAWKADLLRDKDLYLMARWRTWGHGWNTTGSGPLRTEKEKDVMIPVCRLLDEICPIATWTNARELFREIAAGSLGKRGAYGETTGDGVLEEYESSYDYQAVRLRSLYDWLFANGFLR
jgi:hypothetical protein